MTGLSAIASHAGANQTAKAQVGAMERNERLQQGDLTRQAEQQRQAGAAQANEQARKAARDAALFDAVTGEFGGGNTADRAASIGGIQADERLATIRSNAASGLQETSLASYATASRAQSQLASINRPSIIGTGLQIGAAGVKAVEAVDWYDKHTDFTKRNSTIFPWNTPEHLKAKKK